MVLSSRIGCTPNSKMFGMWSISLCKSRDLGGDLGPRIPPCAWARKPNWLRCWLCLTDVQSFNSIRIRWSVVFFFSVEWGGTKLVVSIFISLTVARPFWELDAFPDLEDVDMGQQKCRVMKAGNQHSWLSAHPTGRILNGIRIRDIATRTWILFSVAYVWGSMDLGFTYSVCSTRKAAEKDR